MERERRNNIDIIADILKETKEPLRITGIVYSCNLNFNIVRKKLEYLIKRGLLKNIGNRRYKRTEKAIEFLSRYESLKEYQ